MARCNGGLRRGECGEAPVCVPSFELAKGVFVCVAGERGGEAVLYVFGFFLS